LLTLARAAAKQAVKQQLHSRGIKRRVHAREINAAAQLYLKANARELVEEAWEKVQGSADLMRFYEKEQKDRERKTVHILSQSVITCPARSEVSQ
jgi:hypothetical protein